MIPDTYAPASHTGAAANSIGRPSDLLSIADFSPDETRAVLSLALRIKARPREYSCALSGKQVVLFFEKPSLRTRLTFESGVTSMGGTSFFVDQTASRLGAREPVADMARNLERWVDGIVLRTFSHQTVVEMAEHASIPVINALSDYEHPCQALADYMTLLEKFGDLRRVKLAYVGDGNNMAHSLMLAAVTLGSTIAVATPRGYEPSPAVTALARDIAEETGATITLTHDAVSAVRGSAAVYTDVWASMGQENEAAERKRIFAAYQVNETLFQHADSNAVFMHCLPAHRGDEVTASVIDSPRSVVFEQAENRLHIQKAILLRLLSGGMQMPKRSADA